MSEQTIVENLLNEYQHIEENSVWHHGKDIYIDLGSDITKEKINELQRRFVGIRSDIYRMGGNEYQTIGGNVLDVRGGWFMALWGR